MILGLTLAEWAQAGGAVLTFVTVTGIPLAMKLRKKWKNDGATEAAKAVPALAFENREAFGKLYRQLKAVVKATDLKEEAIQDLVGKLPEEIRSGDVGKSLKKMSLGDARELSSLDLAKIPFKDIVNSKLVKENEANDELLKSLVDSARKDEATNVAIDKVASTLGGLAGEGLNIGTKIATGGTVSAKDVVGVITGVGSSALGAKDSSKS